MARTAVRNVIALAIGVPLYWLLIRYLSTVFDWLGLANERLVGGLLVHLAFGVLGAYAFAGTSVVRALFVFLCITIYGLAMEAVFPDPRHWGAQLFVSVAFGTVAAVAALIASGAQARGDSPGHV
jgi:hypothetical protein